MVKKYLLTFILLTAAVFGWAQNYAPDDTTTEYTMNATFYSDQFIGRKTSSGEVFRQDRYTAAHWKIKLGTLVLVTNINNGKQVIVKVNDRCPKRGVIDLTRKAARTIGVSSHKVKVQILPDSYYYYWEHQDSLLNTMGNSQFLFAQQDTPQPKKLTKPKPAPNPVAAAETDPWAETHEGKSDGHDTYNVDLCVVNSRSEAIQAIKELPIFYQDKATILPSAATNKVKVRLNLSAKHDKAVEIQKELSNMFPQSSVQKAP